MTIEIPDIIMKTIGDIPFKIIEENINKTTLEVTNPKVSSFETNIYLELTPYDMEITFGNYHKSYAAKDMNNYAILANCLNDIIYNNVCTTTLYYYEKDNIKKCAVNIEPTTSVLTKEINDLFPNLSVDDDLRTRIKANGGEIHIQYWDIEQNKILIIPKDENKLNNSRSKDESESILIDSRFGAITLTYSIYEDIKGKKKIPACQTTFIRNDGAIIIRSTAAGSTKIVGEESFSTDLFSVSLLFDDVQEILRNNGFFLDPVSSTGKYADISFSVIYSPEHEETAPALLQYNGKTLLSLVEGFISYAKKEHKYYNWCEVSFDNFNDNCYSYFCNDDTIRVGDNVIVPVGPENEERIARVVSVCKLSKERLPYPAEKTKTIIRKASFDKELNLKRILFFAKNLGLQFIRKIDSWNDYDCWFTFKELENAEDFKFIILVNSNQIRVATIAEKEQILKTYNPQKSHSTVYYLNKYGFIDHDDNTMIGQSTEN